MPGTTLFTFFFSFTSYVLYQLFRILARIPLALVALAQHRSLLTQSYKLDIFHNKYQVIVDSLGINTATTVWNSSWNYYVELFYASLVIITLYRSRYYILRMFFGIRRKKMTCQLESCHVAPDGRFTGWVVVPHSTVWAMFFPPQVVSVSIADKDFVNLVHGIGKTNAPPSTKPVLEMAVKGSTFDKTKPPKMSGIIHCADPSASDLNERIIGVLSRIKQGNTTVGITAYHCFEQIKIRQECGSKVYLHYGGRDFELPKLECLLHSPTHGDNLDIATFDINKNWWSLTGMKMIKFDPRLCVDDIIKVYTPTISGTWLSTIGRVLNPTKLMKFEHSASTRYGTSGSLIIVNNIARGVHTARNPLKGCNSGSSPELLLTREALITETPLPKDQMWCRAERYYDEEEKYEAEDPTNNWRIAFDHNLRMGFDEDAFQQSLRDDDDMGEYSHLHVYSKSEHREYVSMDHKNYTQLEKDENWMRSRGLMETATKSPLPDVVTTPPNTPLPDVPDLSLETSMLQRMENLVELIKTASGLDQPEAEASHDGLVSTNHPSLRTLVGLSSTNHPSLRTLVESQVSSEMPILVHDALSSTNQPSLRTVVESQVTEPVVEPLPDTTKPSLKEVIRQALMDLYATGSLQESQLPLPNPLQVERKESEPIAIPSTLVEEFGDTPLEELKEESSSSLNLGGLSAPRQNSCPPNSASTNGLTARVLSQTTPKPLLLEQSLGKSQKPRDGASSAQLRAHSPQRAGSGKKKRRRKKNKGSPDSETGTNQTSASTLQSGASELKALDDNIRALQKQLSSRMRELKSSQNTQEPPAQLDSTKV